MKYYFIEKVIISTHMGDQISKSVSQRNRNKHRSCISAFSFSSTTEWPFSRMGILTIPYTLSESKWDPVLQVYSEGVFRVIAKRKTGTQVHCTFLWNMIRNIKCSSTAKIQFLNGYLDVELYSLWQYFFGETIVSLR